MSYWLFALFAALAIAVINGDADRSTLILLLLVAAPLFILNLAMQFVRSLFTRGAALELGAIVAGLAAAGLLATFYFSAYYLY